MLNFTTWKVALRSFLRRRLVRSSCNRLHEIKSYFLVVSNGLLSVAKFSKYELDQSSYGGRYTLQ